MNTDTDHRPQWTTNSTDDTDEGSTAPARRGLPHYTFEYATHSEEDNIDARAARAEDIAAADAIAAKHPGDNHDATIQHMLKTREVVKVTTSPDGTSIGFTLALPVEAAQTAWRDGDFGRITKVLTEGIIGSQSPDLFDGNEIKRRDEEARRIKAASATPLRRARDAKPITLTTRQVRTLTALACIATHPEEIKRGTVRRKIDNPQGGERSVCRRITLEAITRMIYGRNGQREQAIVLEDLRALGNTQQTVVLPSGAVVHAALINIIWERPARIVIGKGIATRRGHPQAIYSDNDTYEIDIRLGMYFFLDARDTYAPLYPRTLFAAWRKKGRGTELFVRLLFELLYVYIAICRRTAAIRHRIEKEAARAGKRATWETIERLTREEVQRARLERVHFNIDTLKGLAKRDYTSSKVYTALFWRDLDAAIEGLKEVGIITGASSTAATAQAGTRRKLRPRQIVFTINLDYNKTATATAPAEGSNALSITINNQ